MDLVSKPNLYTVRQKMKTPKCIDCACIISLYSMHICIYYTEWKFVRRTQGCFYCPELFYYVGPTTTRPRDRWAGNNGSERKRRARLHFLKSPQRGSPSRTRRSYTIQFPNVLYASLSDVAYHIRRLLLFFFSEKIVTYFTMRNWWFSIG